MNRKLITYYFLPALAFLSFSCDFSDNYYPKGDYISGYITFVDTNFMSSGGYYAVALYSNQSSPYNSIPLTTDTLKIAGATSPYNYRIYYENKSACFLGIIWERTTSESEIPRVLGTYGCDTSYSCTDFKSINFPNFTGANYDVICWTDTTH